jgi:hypothetical protein
MASQTVTTTLNYDSASISALLDGESITVNGGSLTIDADTRLNQQAAVFGQVTLSSTLGGEFIVNGTKVWEIPFSASTGNVPTQGALGSNGVTGGTSGATGELTRVWASNSFNPSAAGGAMPSTGYIKLRLKTGTFVSGETITLPGGATITASSAGKRGAIQVFAASGFYLNVPRLAKCSITGDWYDLGTTNGADNQTFTLPIREEIGGILIEISAGSGVYEWYANAGDIWNGHYYINELLTITNGTLTRNAVAAFPYPATERLRETAVAGVHSASFALGSNTTTFPAGVMTFSPVLKQDGRQWAVVQFATNGSADRYGVLVDLSAGTIIATPTVGSPTGTASSITSLGNGLYRINVTINHTGTGAVTIATADSATPTYTFGLPTFTGNTAQGVAISLTRLEMASYSFIPTDVRGKHCFSDPITGTVQLALRGTNNSGFKPPTGCKVIIPNVFLSTSTATDYSAPMLTATNTRYYVSATSSGVLNLNNVVFNWFNVGFSTVANACTTQYFAGASSIANACMGSGLIAASANVALSSFFAASITDSRFCRRQTPPFSTSSCANVTISRCRFDLIGYYPGISQRTSSGNQSGVTLGASNFFVEDCEVINCGITFNAAGVKIKNLKYADVMTNTTPAFQSTAIQGLGSNIEIDGFSSLGGIANVHPNLSIHTVTGYYTSLSISNIGTPSVPFDCGSVNAMQYILNGYIGSPTVMRRVYTTNIRNSPFTLPSGSNGVQLFDVWGTGSQFIDIQAPNLVSRGGRWTNMKRGFSGANGTHWDDAYDSATTGRITLMANEPTAASSGQFSAILGTGSGYTGSGTIVISKLTDQLIWTSPYKFYGHTAFGGGCSVGGTDTQNLLWEYKIDTGSGFGAWTFLANTVRTSSDPTTGANTVTVNSTDLAALARQPQVGDFIQHSTLRLPQDTTITGIAGSVITCSNNFIASILGNNGTISFSPVNATVSPSAGYSLQVRCYPTTAATTTAISGFHAGTKTNATAQQIQHPLPGTILTFTGLQTGTELHVYRESDSEELAGTEATFGSVFSYEYQYTSDTPIFVTIIKPGYKWLRFPLTLSASNQSIPILMQVDFSYSNPS